MTDDRLRAVLRAALPAAEDDALRPMWPSIVDRIERRPRWSAVDVGLAAAIVAALLLSPEWRWLLLYHL